MEESDTYLMILDEGQAMAFRWVIQVWGEDRLGPPDASVPAALQDITDLDRLLRMALRAPKAASWQEILDTP